MITPIQIFTQNLISSASMLSSSSAENIAFLIDNNPSSLWQCSAAEHVLTVTFPADVDIDTFVLSNTNAQSVNIAYKQNAQQENFTQFTSFVQLSGGDILLSFPSVLTAQVLKFTFTCSDAVFYCGGINLCKKLLSLENVLSSLKPSAYFRGGHHYLSDGSLLTWSDFNKLSFDVTLTNVPKAAAQNLLLLFKNNSFLTYALYGGYDAAFCRQFALNAPPVISLERKTALYQLEFTLLEK